MKKWMGVDIFQVGGVDIVMVHICIIAMIYVHQKQKTDTGNSTAKPI